MAEDPRTRAIEEWRKKVVAHREVEAKVRALRDDVRAAKKDYDKTEDDLKALQSVGQIIGEVLRQLDEERCECRLRACGCSCWPMQLSGQCQECNAACRHAGGEHCSLRAGAPAFCCLAACPQCPLLPPPCCCLPCALAASSLTCRTMVSSHRQV